MEAKAIVGYSANEEEEEEEEEWGRNEPMVLKFEIYYYNYYYCNFLLLSCLEYSIWNTLWIL